MSDYWDVLYLPLPNSPLKINDFFLLKLQSTPLHNIELFVIVQFGKARVGIY